jgi:hypothetical protein
MVSWGIDLPRFCALTIVPKLRLGEDPR